jgi:hypothetical protein
VSRRIVTVPGFDLSVAGLGGSAEVREVVKALIARAERYPENAPRLPGLEARVVKSRSYGDYPALRLLYRVDEETIYLYEVASYDELSDDAID